MRHRIALAEAEFTAILAGSRVSLRAGVPRVMAPKLH